MASGVAVVETDADSGTVYFVMTVSAVAPSAAQIIAGTDHLDAAAPASGSIVVSAAGEVSDAVVGLAESTQYYTYFVQDNLGELSNVFSAPAVLT